MLDNQKKIEPKTNKQRSKFFRLEDRIVFDASLPILIDDADNALPEVDVFSTNSIDPSEQASIEEARYERSALEAPVYSLAPQGEEVAFIDSTLPDIAQLLAGFGPNVEVYTVPDDAEGFDFIAKTLAGRDNISAIHIVGHGDPSAIILGSGALTPETLEATTAQLKTIGSALTETGDILLYGCDVAADPASQDFIRQIAQITGADIAASVDGTGSAALGSDWELEFTVGEIEAAGIDVPEWDNILHTRSVGFLISEGAAAGDNLYDVQAFFGSWHSGNIAALGRAVLYSMRAGGNPTNPADFTVIAYGDNYNTSGTNEFIFSRRTSVAFQHEGSGNYTVNEINAAQETWSISKTGFTVGQNYFWSNGTKLVDYSTGGTYNHQSAIIAGVAPGTYRLDYELPKPTDATWAPIKGVDNVIFTIGAGGSLQVAGAASPVTFAVNEDVDFAVTKTLFTTSFSGTLGDVKITQIPTHGKLYVGSTLVTANTIISSANLTGGNVKYVADPDYSGSDSFKWSGYDTGASKWSDIADGIINVSPVNDAPTLSVTGKTVTFTEGVFTPERGVSVFSGATLSTYETSQTITGLTITVTNIADGSDERLIIEGSEFALLNNESGRAPTFQYSVSNSGSTSTVTLSGMNLSAADAQKLINSVAYVNTSNDPTVTGGRTLMVTSIKDSGGTANGGVESASYSAAANSGMVATVSITSVNNAPTISALATTATYYENTDANQDYGSVNVFRNAVITGGETSDTIKSLSFTVSNVEATDYLKIDGSNISLANNPTAVTSTNGNVTIVVSVTNGVATVTLTEASAGSLSASEASAILNNLKYSSHSENPSSANRVVSITQVVDNGGGSSDTISPSITSTITVVPVNDAPVITVPSTDYITTKTTANTTGAFNLTGLSISDADPLLVAGKEMTVVLSLSNDGKATPNQYGKITFSSTTLGTATVTGNGTDNVTITGTVADINTLLATNPSYEALLGQDIVDDGLNRLTITATDTGSPAKVTVATKDITVLPAPPNSQSFNAIGVEDTNLVTISDLNDKITIAGAATAAPGYFTYGATGTFDKSAELSGDGTTTTFTTFAGGSSSTIEVWATPSGGTPQLLSSGYTLDTTTGSITFTSAPATGTAILVKTTDGTITQGTTVTGPNSAVGLDLGNGELYLAHVDAFATGDATGSGPYSYTLSNIAINTAVDDLAFRIEGPNGSITPLSVVASLSSPVDATEATYDGSTQTVTMSVALNAGQKLVVSQAYGDITNPGLGGSTIFIPDADFFGTDEFYFQYNSPRDTVASGDGTTLEFTVDLATKGAVVGAVVTVGSTEMTEGTEYDLDTVNNKIVFKAGNAPASGTNNVTITTTVKSPVSRALLYVAGVNDAPTASVSTSFLDLHEDIASQSVSLGSSAFTDIANEIGDGTGSEYEARLSVTNGKLSFTDTNGDSNASTTVRVFDGADNSGFLVLRGNAADLKATLNTLEYTPDTDYFTKSVALLGDGTNTSFAIGSDIANANDVYVYVNKARVTSGFTVDTTTDEIIFASAPANGANVEFVLASDADKLTFTISDLGNSGAGGAKWDTKELKLVVQNIDDKPVVTAESLNASFTEKGLSVFIFDNTKINLQEASDKVESFTFTMSGLTDGTAERIILDGKEIQLVNGSGTTTNAYGVGYTVTLNSGVATVKVTKAGGLAVSDAEKLIDTIRYLNTSSNPTDPATPRSVTITELVDTGGTGGSPAGIDTTALTIASSMGIQGINSAPVITAVTTGMTVMHMEDTTASSIFSGVTIDTIEADQKLLHLKFSVSEVVDKGHEYIVVDGKEILLANTTSPQVTSNGHRVAITMSGSTATVSIDTNAQNSATVAQMQSLIEGIKYRNSSQAPTNENNRVVTLLALQDDGGKASGGEDLSNSPTLLASGGVISRDIMVMGVNDAPFTIGALKDQTMVTGDKYRVLAAPVFSDIEGDGIIYSAEGLPEGVTIDSATGIISGRPLAAGIFEIKITATDSLGASNSVTYRDTITSPSRNSEGGKGQQNSIKISGPNFEPDVTNKTTQNMLGGGQGRSSGFGSGDSNRDFGRGQPSEITTTRSNTVNSFDNVTLMVGRPLPDLSLRPGVTKSVVVPTDTFVTSSADGINGLALSATLADGNELPEWITFDAQKNSLEVNPPAGFEGEVQVVVRAVDANGNQVSVTSTITVDDNAAEEPAESEDGAWLDISKEPNEKIAQIDWDSLGRVFEEASKTKSTTGSLSLRQQLA